MPIEDVAKNQLHIEALDVASAMQSLFGAQTGEDGAGKRAPKTPSAQLAIDPENVEQDLAKLVLTLIEFLRNLLELQAIRRMEAGALSDEEEERLGETFMRARAQIEGLAEQFGISPDDLTLDLGPLGKLM